ncbi:MAG: Lrp/AsnC family transcriptional regulator [Candidatus Helarchaeota archaeon]
MESEYHLDEIDRRILKFLSKDAKKPLKEIADAVGKTETTIRRRIKTLEDKGVISGYTIRVFLPAKENKIKAFLRIDPNISKTREIAKRLLEFPEVEHVYFMSGECGIWAKVALNDIPHLDGFLEKHISQIDGIKGVINCIILNEMIKENGN